MFKESLSILLDNNETIDINVASKTTFSIVPSNKPTITYVKIAVRRFISNQGNLYFTESLNVPLIFSSSATSPRRIIYEILF
jgi:hypothetical protein